MTLQLQQRNYVARFRQPATRNRRAGRRFQGKLTKRLVNYKQGALIVLQSQRHFKAMLFSRHGGSQPRVDHRVRDRLRLGRCSRSHFKTHQSLFANCYFDLLSQYHACTLRRLARHWRQGLNDRIKHRLGHNHHCRLADQRKGLYPVCTVLGNARCCFG